MLKIWLKFQIFDQRWPVKHEIWQNEEIWAALKIWLKFQILDHRGPVKHQIWRNVEFEPRGKFDSNLRYLTTADLWNMKFGNMQSLSHVENLT